MRILFLARPHPCPLPQERENRRPAIGYDKRGNRFQNISRDQRLVTSSPTMPLNLLKPISHCLIQAMTHTRGEAK